MGNIIGDSKFESGKWNWILEFGICDMGFWIGTGIGKYNWGFRSQATVILLILTKFLLIDLIDLNVFPKFSSALHERYKKTDLYFVKIKD